MISGFVMANKGEKISKSKGNSNVEPLDLIKQFSADVVRYGLLLVDWEQILHLVKRLYFGKKVS